MEGEKRLIDAIAFFKEHCAACKYFNVNGICEKENPVCGSARIVAELPTVDAVEVAKIEEVKQEILQVLDNLIDADEPLAYWSVNDSSSYYSGKIQAYEVARRLVNAALTDLCGAKMDGERKDNG